MLHGCGQTPEDFAAGTRMNELADMHGLVVAYPAQSPAANVFTCWNWFLGRDQVRDGGEPELIAGIARQVAADHAVDATRIFIAGLSAGGAMAVILGATHPELFSAVGVHSGLPYRAAHDAASAAAAMRFGAAPALPPLLTQPKPTIVFHGERDTTVDFHNGAAIVDQAVSSAERAWGTLRMATREGRSGGRSYTTTTYGAAKPHGALSTDPFIEYWELRGAGHAWSGGSSKGSYTDESGPDASAEMVRFFLGTSTLKRPAP
jgi:poly(hydroxyalkanoate) depolymerase family esterase